MTHPLRLLWLCSALFVVLGLGFVFFPGPLASLLTSGEPLTPAALTDLRASYGGTSFGIGLLLGYAALRPRYLVLGLLAALAVIASGGAARLYGVLIDASPETMMVGGRRSPAARRCTISTPEMPGRRTSLSSRSGAEPPSIMSRADSASSTARGS